MRKTLFWLLLPLLAWCVLLPGRPVQAATLDYQALTHGTQKQSLAAKYYVKPAQVVANGNQYLVTMTIHTAKNLGRWPVTVLRINGVGPANVAKTQDATGYNYRYAFETADLSQTVTSDIAIDVYHVYSGQHAIDFKFDTSALPKLAATAAAKPATPKTKPLAADKAQVAQAAQARQNAAAIVALNRKNQQTQHAILASGGVSLATLAVAAYFFIKRH